MPLGWWTAAGYDMWCSQSSVPMAHTGMGDFGQDKKPGVLCEWVACVGGYADLSGCCLGKGRSWAEILVQATDVDKGGNCGTLELWGCSGAQCWSLGAARSASEQRRCKRQQSQLSNCAEAALLPLCCWMVMGKDTRKPRSSLGIGWRIK